MARGKPTDEFDLASGNAPANPIAATGDSGGDNGGVGNPKVVDPAEVRGSGDSNDYTGGTNKDGSPTRKRGRKAGSTGPRQAHTPADIGAIQATLLSFHALLAQKVPEMEINELEATRLAEGIVRVEKYYPAVSAVISGRIADHVALASTLIAVYGVRFAAIKVRKTREANNKGDSGVIDMTDQFRKKNPQPAE